MNISFMTMNRILFHILIFFLNYRVNFTLFYDSSFIKTFKDAFDLFIFMLTLLEYLLVIHFLDAPS